MITLTAAARNAAADAIADLVDAGSTDAGGDLVIRDAGDNELAILALSNPAFGAAAAGVVAANSITDESSATAGTADHFIVRDRDNVEVFRGSVGVAGSGADLIVATTTIASGQVISVSSFSCTMPAS